MTASSAAGHKPLPSERTIAFAISIVRSKPPELSVAEYIQLLRQHIAKGRRENALSSAYRHLDRSSYWRAEFERMKAAFDSIEGENVDLHRQVNGLKDKIANAKAGPTKKRKRVDEDVIPVPKSPRKAKASSISAQQSEPPFALDVDWSVAEPGEAGSVLVRSLFKVHASLKSRPPVEPAVLAYHLTQAADALPQAIFKALEHDRRLSHGATEDFKSVSIATGRSFRLLVAGFNKLASISSGKEAQGHVIYALVRMYGNLVNLFQDISMAELQDSGSASTDQSLPPKKTKQSNSSPMKEVPLLDLLTKLLGCMIDELDSKIEAHKALFEGFAFVVLSRLGPKLYATVFGHEPGPSIEQQISTWTQPKESAEDGRARWEVSEGQELDATRLEAPYLIHLLNHIMIAAPAHLGAVLSAKTGKPTTANNRGSMKGALTIAAKEQLQKTLVNCMFGDISPGDCLSMPVVISPSLPLPKLKGMDMKDWFQEEIWRLLGWEILSGKRDW